MTEYLFLYRSEGNATRPAADNEITQRWMAWIRSLADRGHLKERGLPLENAGKVVTAKPGVITDGPYVETKDLVCGFSLITANNLDQAADLTAGCPIFEIGGTVEVRPAISLG